MSEEESADPDPGLSEPPDDSSEQTDDEASWIPSPEGIVQLALGIILGASDGP